jgi:hypothetical protein
MSVPSYSYGSLEELSSMAWMDSGQALTLFGESKRRSRRVPMIQHKMVLTSKGALWPRIWR